MIRRRPDWSRSTLAVFTALVIAVPISVLGGAAGATARQVSPPAEKTVLFASDGMRPDLVDRYVAQGAMPTMKDLTTHGVKGQNGLMQGFPPNTGVGWSTLATGTWPSEHGSTNNTFHRTGEGNFNNSTSFSATGLIQARLTTSPRRPSAPPSR